LILKIHSRIPEFGDLSAIFACDKLKIQSQVPTEQNLPIISILRIESETAA
jgi:hypothetical protein